MCGKVQQNTIIPNGTDLFFTIFFIKLQGSLYWQNNERNLLYVFNRILRAVSKQLFSEVWHWHVFSPYFHSCIILVGLINAIFSRQSYKALLFSTLCTMSKYRYHKLVYMVYQFSVAMITVSRRNCKIAWCAASCVVIRCITSDAHHTLTNNHRMRGHKKKG